MACCSLNASASRVFLFLLSLCLSISTTNAWEHRCDPPARESYLETFASLPSAQRDSKIKSFDNRCLLESSIKGIVFPFFCAAGTLVLFFTCLYLTTSQKGGKLFGGGNGKVKKGPPDIELTKFEQEWWKQEFDRSLVLLWGGAVLFIETTTTLFSCNSDASFEIIRTSTLSFYNILSCTNTYTHHSSSMIHTSAIFPWVFDASQ